ncbi:MAG: COX15/CtaA family protein [Dehalococcoidia bacterium]|nr:COX15/CtaA family protein [Dehalococcoidia bacterium]
MTNAERLAAATAVATLFLVAVGAFVRASGSGLGCPDWPTCHGGALPPSGHTEAWIEFSHRFVASVVGLMVIGTALMAWKYYRHVRFIVVTAIVTVPLVGFQGVLGAITVWRELPPEVVATHLVTAMIVLLCQVAVAVAMYLEDPAHREQVISGAQKVAARKIGILAVASLIWLAIAMWVGGYMTESGAATACADWPGCNGAASLLPGNDDQEITHMLHRYLAGGLVFVLGPFVALAWRERRQFFWAGPVAVATGALFTAQVIVGALNVWYEFPEPLTVSHTTIAAGVWFALAVGAMFAYYAPVSERRGVRTPAGIEVPA